MTSSAYALIIVDMQNDFVLPGAPAAVAGAFATLPKIREALDFWHVKEWPVVYLYREYRRDGSDIEITRMETFLRHLKFCLPGSQGAEIVSAIAPAAGDYLVMKNRFSGFMDTELDFKEDATVIRDAGGQCSNYFRLDVHFENTVGTSTRCRNACD